MTKSPIYPLSVFITKTATKPYKNINHGKSRSGHQKYPIGSGFVLSGKAFIVSAVISLSESYSLLNANKTHATIVYTCTVDKRR